jgi:WD40 repeat protein
MPRTIETNRRAGRSIRSKSCWIFLATALLTSGLAFAEPPRTDRLGDPLPEGAVARLGTARLRHEVVAHNTLMATFTADGRYLVSSDGSIVYVWDSRTGRAVKRWTGQDWGEVRRLVSSPDGKALLIATTRGIWLADMAGQGEARARDTWQDGRHRATGWSAFMPGGKELISMEFGTEIRVLNVYQSASRRAEYVNAMPLVGLSRDGKTMTIWNQDEIERWDVATLKRTSTVKFPYYGKFRKLRMRPDGSLLAVNLDEGGVIFWDPVAAKEVGRLSDSTLVAETGMQFTPDGSRLVTVSPEATIAAVQTWNVAGGKKEYSFSVPILQAGEPVVSPDGEMIAFATMTSNISLRNLRTGSEPFGRSGFESAPLALSFVAGNRLAAADQTSICCWNYASGELLSQISQSNRISCLLIPSDGKSAITFGSEGLQQCDLNTGRKLGGFLPPSMPVAMKNDIGSVAMSPNGRTIRALAQRLDGTRLHLVEWDLTTRQPTSKWSIPINAAGWAADNSIQADDKRIFRIAGPYVVALKPETLSLDWNGGEFGITPGEIVLHDLTNERASITFSPSNSPDLVACTRTVLAAVSRWQPDQIRNVTIKPDTILESWEIITGDKIAKWTIPTTKAFALSPNGRTIALALGQQIEFRDLTGDGDTVVRPAESEAYCLMFSPDGRWLASGHNNGTILIWDVNAALRIKPNSQTLTRTQREVCWAELSRDARSTIRASNRLAADPASAIELLRERLKPIDSVDPDRIKRLLVKLDSPQYSARESASSELAALGERIRPRLKAAMLTSTSAEVRHRLGLLLADSAVVPSPRRWRQFRAIALLERIGTSEAAAILSNLTKGDPAASETQAAIEALKRISEPRN